VRPTLAELVDRIRSDFRGRLGIDGSLVRRAMADVLAATWAGAVHMVHGHIEWLSKQLFADTAEEDFLLRIAGMYGIAPTPATFASGDVLATGTNGTIIPDGTILVRDDGILYETQGAETITGGNATVTVQCLTAGATGNMPQLDLLTLQTPIAGCNSELVADPDAVSGGSDEEDTEALRARLISRLRQPPEGGTEEDYIAWALAVPGVTRVWVYPHEDGLGTVVVRFVRDNDAGSIIPAAGEVSDVQDALDAERPVTAEVTVEAPTSSALDFTIAVEPDTAEVRAAVEAELTDLLFREAEPGDGAGRGTILLSQIHTAIGTAEGVEDYTLTVPAANVVPTTGQLKVLGAVTWV
jgi:uncharacterized phage protein gp47/JayE